MKKKLIQDLESNCLKRIRTSFRRLWIQKIATIQLGYQKEQSQLERSDPDYIVKYHDLEEKWWVLERLIRNSIAQCPACKASDKNMTYNPFLKQWFCNECYQLNHNFYFDKDESHLFP
ncbi:MAG: hypothetical protein GF311_00230 [Candidatus Lokiarchaeota archaeon]|nr:hypothetical protein [Candidatus Lokiarchaeota archaeon]